MSFMTDAAIMTTKISLDSIAAAHLRTVRHHLEQGTTKRVSTNEVIAHALRVAVEQIEGKKGRGK